MKREEARPGVEFGHNDFRPSWRGIRSPSSSPRKRPTGKRDFYLALAFAFLGFLIVGIFYTAKHSPKDKVYRPQNQVQSSRITERVSRNRSNSEYKPDVSEKSYSSSENQFRVSHIPERQYKRRYDPKLLDEILETMESLLKTCDEFVD